MSLSKNFLPLSSFFKEILLQADIIGIGETEHGTHNEFFNELSYLDASICNQISGIFIEMPVDFQASVNYYLTTQEFDKKITGLIQGAESEGKFFRPMWTSILNFAITLNIPVFCTDSSKTPRFGYHKSFSEKSWYIKEGSRDEDMFSIIRTEVDNHPKGKWLFIAGAGHVIKLPEIKGDDPAGKKLKNYYGKRYFPVSINNSSLIDKSITENIICFDLLNKRCDPMLLKLLDYEVPNNYTFKPSPEMFDGFIFCH